MRYSALLRRIKKNLRRKMKRMALGLVVILLMVGAGIAYFASKDEATLPAWSGPSNVYDVYIKKIHLCGEETTYTGRLEASEIERMQRDHPHWERETADGDRLFFVERLDEEQVDCENTYFGITTDGQLSLFEGLPQQRKMIRTFFQLDIQYLESSLPQETVRQLYEGIRVRDRDEFNSVLSTFSPYAIDGALEKEH